MSDISQRPPKLSDFPRRPPPGAVVPPWSASLRPPFTVPARGQSADPACSDSPATRSSRERISASSYPLACVRASHVLRLGRECGRGADKRSSPSSRLHGWTVPMSTATGWGVRAQRAVITRASHVRPGIAVALSVSACRDVYLPLSERDCECEYASCTTISIDVELYIPSLFPPKSPHFPESRRVFLRSRLTQAKSERSCSRDLFRSNMRFPLQINHLTQQAHTPSLCPHTLDSLQVEPKALSDKKNNQKNTKRCPFSESNRGSSHIGCITN